MRIAALAGKAVLQRAELTGRSIPSTVVLRGRPIHERMGQLEMTVPCAWTLSQSCDLTEGLLDETSRAQVNGQTRLNSGELTMYCRRETARRAFATQQQQQRHDSRRGKGVHLWIRPLYQMSIGKRRSVSHDPQIPDGQTKLTYRHRER